jgi:hypothetical protein
MESSCGDGVIGIRPAWTLTTVPIVRSRSLSFVTNRRVRKEVKKTKAVRNVSMQRV